MHVTAQSLGLCLYGEVCRVRHWAIKFALGTSKLESPMKTRKTTKKSSGNYPDLAIIAIGSHLLRITGEVKTEWTFFPNEGQTA